MGNLRFRIRHSLYSTNIILLCIGTGVTIISSFAQIGWEMSIIFARALTFIGVALVVMGIALAIWRFFKNPIEKKDRIYSIISILSDMEKCLWQLAEKQRGENIAWQKYSQTMHKISQLVDVTVPNAVSINEVKKETTSLESKLREKIFINGQPINQKVEIMQAISRLLDSDGFGLKVQRGSDKSYLRLNKLVDEYYDDYKSAIDKDLDALVKLHKDLVEALANAFLVKKHVLYVITFANEFIDISDLFSPSMQAKLEGLEDDTKDILRGIRIQISQHIRRFLNKECVIEKI